MSRTAVLFGVVIFAIIVTWNSWLLIKWTNSNVQGNSGSPEPQLWLDIKETLVNESSNGPRKPVFNESVIAANGKRVILPGVGFPLSSGVRENEQGEREVTEFLLLPGNGGVAWCCGITPIPRIEHSILVDCSNAPFNDSKVNPGSPVLFVAVEGVLRLQKANSISSLYMLENVSIKFLDAKDVMPPNVLNQCLNQPMNP